MIVAPILPIGYNTIRFFTRKWGDEMLEKESQQNSEELVKKREEFRRDISTYFESEYAPPINKEFLDELDRLKKQLPTIPKRKGFFESPLLLFITISMGLLVILLAFLIEDFTFAGLGGLLMSLPLLYDAWTKFRDNNRIKRGKFERYRDVLQALTYKYWLESGLRPSLEETALNLNVVIQHDELGDFPFQYRSLNILEFFNRLQKFLIIGEAGSGKTVILLQLATKLLSKAIGNAKEPIPLVLNLSSWGNDNIPFENWILQESEITYGIPKAIIRHWLDNGDVYLLLDGLDEIRADEPYRQTLADRVQKINDYLNNKTTPIVICTRPAEYQFSHGGDNQKKLQFLYGIEIKELDKDQIQAYIDSQPKMKGFQELYQEDEIVKTLAHNPFLLTTMTYTYTGKTKTQLLENVEPNIISRQQHLFDTYFEKQMHSSRYKIGDVRPVLQWIATKTTAFGTVFRADKVTIEWFRWDYDVISIYQFATQRFIPNFLRNIITHRLILTKLPHNYNQFVHDLTSRQILRPFGGGHTFRHNYLRQSFFRDNEIVMAQIESLIFDFVNSNKRESAADKIVQFGSAAVDPLIDYLVTIIATERYMHLYHYTETSNNTLHNTLQRMDDIRQEILRALIKIGKADINPLIFNLGNGDLEASISGTEVLVKIGKGAVELLIARLDTMDSFRCCVVAEALGEIGDISAVEPLIAHLKSINSDVHGTVAEALGRIEDIRAVKSLIPLLKNTSWCRFTNKPVYDSAAEALRKIGTPEALQALRDAGFDA